ncbi:hypothetical protein SAMN05421689_11930 [Leptospira interrogans]|nr:Uncharacterized protein A9P81_0077 [Leptospira interrogans serovar Copenhageni/Icterohaemorrhagiae]SIQ68414.1 hypothetical protein SAMN05421689_11930 [Leptospira interrogans]
MARVIQRLITEDYEWAFFIKNRECCKILELYYIL